MDRFLRLLGRTAGQQTLGALSCIVLLGCGPARAPGATSVGGDGGRPAQTDDPDPVFTDEELAALRALSADPLPPPPADSSNRWADDPAAARFGQRLFFEPLFAGQLLDGDNDGTDNALGHKGEAGKVACAGCHLPGSGFVDTRSVQQQVSLAAGWSLRRTPSLLDVGHSTLLGWDGRRDAMFNQIFGPIESALEMNSSRLFVAQQVFKLHRAEYEALFGPLPALDDTARFPALAADQTGCSTLEMSARCTTVQRGAPGDGAEFDGMAAADQEAVTRVVVNLGKALGAYERLLSCGPSRFDDFVKGDTTALSRAEQRGAALFVGKGRCSECHAGPFMSDERFHNVGLKPATVATVFIDLNDAGASQGLGQMLVDALNTKGPFSDGYDGRIPDAVTAEHQGAFRTPKLRCVGKRPSFMHTGQLRTLDQVVAFFNRGGDTAGYLGASEITPLELSARERTDLVSFMKALDGPGPSSELLAAP